MGHDSYLTKLYYEKFLLEPKCVLINLTKLASEQHCVVLDTNPKCQCWFYESVHRYKLSCIVKYYTEV